MGLPSQPHTVSIPSDVPKDVLIPSSKPLNILICGAGIGGLTAALGFRRQGHKVTVFEQSRLATGIGAAINVAPNGNNILRRLGVILENYQGVECSALIECGLDGKVISMADRSNDSATYGSPFFLIHRAHLHEAIRDQVVSDQGVGTPCTLKTSSRIADVDAAAGTVKLEDGSEFVGDLVIGADGMRSRTRAKVPNGTSVAPKGTNQAAFRFLIDCKTLEEDPRTAPLLSQYGSLVRIPGGEGQVIVIYPCSDNKVMNFMYVTPKSVTGLPEDGGWEKETSVKHMLSIASPSMCDTFRAVLEKAVEPKMWELMDMEDLPVWIEGKLALIGDAAHPFTPWIGQGGAIAMEDGASLAALMPAGTKPEDVKERLDLYQKVRHERASYIQNCSRNNTPTGKKPSILRNPDFQAYLMDWDEWRNSAHVLRDTLKAKAQATA